MTSGDLGLPKPEPLLRVSALSVDYDVAGGNVVHALRNLDLEIAGGESVGVLGESGSGKSSLALALMRLLPKNAHQVSGRIDYRSRCITEFSSAELRAMRGAQVALISQEPALALNPVLSLGQQLADVLLAHGKLARKEVGARCNEMLRQVGFTDSERILRAYPHELSGGQRQRVAIAQALICRPKLLIADEPLSALDAATQADILELLQRMKRDLGLAMLFITHNAGALASLADNVIVMREGEAVARGIMDALQVSQDEYVQGILFPEKSLANAAHKERSIPSGAPLLDVRKLSKRFVQKRLLSRKAFVVQSLDGIDLSLSAGSTVAVLGRSGSGKSTLARCIAGFETPDAGEILLDGNSIMRTAGKKNLRWQTEVQMIFQDAATSLNPRFTARQIVAEPLDIKRWKTEADRTVRALKLMEEVGLDPDWASRLAGEFSGGQRQRLALARALAAEPKLLIMDEALSGLDMPLQAQMVRLLMDLQARHGLTYLYISHDLNFISLFAQEIVVMDAGRIVERTTPEKLGQSVHPATRELVEAGERLHAPGVEAAAMIRYFARRAGHGLLMLFGVSILLFLLFQAAPGDFLSDARVNSQISAETLAQLRAQYGLDQPLPARYWQWIKSSAKGEFGYSFAYNTPASTLLWPRARNTLLLSMPALLISWLIAVPLGVLAAGWKGRWADRLFSGGTSALLALPDVLIALLALLIALKTGMFPVGGMTSINAQDQRTWSWLRDLSWHMVLPVAALVVGSLTIILRHVRASVSEVLESSYMRAAEGHGLPRFKLLFGYALPAAANPLISLFGLSVAMLLSVSLLIEVVMSWPGIGPLLLEAILARDLFVVIGAVMLSTVFLIIGNLLGDVLLYAFDPRIRRQA